MNEFSRVCMYRCYNRLTSVCIDTSRYQARSVGLRLPGGVLFVLYACAHRPTVIELYALHVAGVMRGVET